MARKNAQAYVLRTVKAHNGTTFGSLTVPAEVYDRVPPDTRFTIEMTEDGILYRPIAPVQEVAPSWAKS